MNSKYNILPTFLESNIKIPKVLDIFELNTFISKYYIKEKLICPICLNICIFPCKSDKCSHAFCFRCLEIWSYSKKICPLCRKAFTNIISI